MSNCISDIFGIAQSRPAYETSEANTLYADVQSMLSQFRMSVPVSTEINNSFIEFCTLKGAVNVAKAFLAKAFSDTKWKEYFACVAANQSEIDGDI